MNRTKQILCTVLLFALSSFATRVKDVATLDGLSSQHLVGYGLVVGLAGTGDGNNTMFTVQSVANMLKKLGIEVPTEKMRLRNVAAVMITGELLPFAKPGQKMDVNVASLGDARSLEGGTLLMTPMQAADGEYYAMAQGALSVGGNYAGSNKSGASHIQKNQPLNGNIPDGAIVRREAEQAAFSENGVLRWVLAEPDFSSAVSMAGAINKIYPNAAKAQDASTVLVNIPTADQSDLMTFIAKSENAEFTPSVNARVVLNEKTGTLVSGADVSISEVAVSHGSIVIQVDAKTTVSQPNALSHGMTASVTNEEVAMKAPEPKPEVKVMPAVTNAGQLAQALNTLGVAPQDIISIFQAIKKAGALHAELILM